jgi:hypothetical protein
VNKHGPLNEHYTSTTHYDWWAGPTVSGPCGQLGPGQGCALIGVAVGNDSYNPEYSLDILGDKGYNGSCPINTHPH